MSEVKLGSQIWVKEEKTHQKVLTKRKKKKVRANEFQVLHIQTLANHNST
jgi:uncharacterized protein YggL (DUF469 family)